jgi:Zn-dependent peptidase ImmA (M78 family)
VKSIVVQGMSRSKIEQDATSLLKRIQPKAYYEDEATDVEYIFEFYLGDEYGIKTGYTDLSSLPGDVMGYTDAAKKICLIDKTLIDSEFPVTIRRCRSTIGHEVGHCILHVPAIRDYISCLSRNQADAFHRKEKSQIKAYEDPEWQAWEYAGALLMPRNRVLKYAEAGLTTKQMADRFDVNGAFMNYRLKHQLKLNPF